MRILAFDTAMNACSAAVSADGQVRARERVPMERGHAEALIPMVTRVMAEAGLRYAQLDRIAVTVGPGAFTGLRIGLAAARGLAIAAGIPVSGVTTLEALAHGADAGLRSGRPVLAVIDAKRADVYAQLFDPGLRPLSQPQSLLPDELPATLADPGRPMLLVGDGASRAAPALIAAGLELEVASESQTPDPAVVAMLAAGRTDADQRSAVPLYLRPPQATRPAHGGRLRP
ncbi:MAG: tRNA (adenosine(37)-N6)-threonylcarbamoyltransferase complex dimerization subunit type 1 TsaB [Alphaproteobacteria bacterium]|nr:tRNA (adenosine(37)-N6)-threonylcarbamoyltransferase complex dimerization subunit type 1 TsaB [Alphaproteobacteria bacterium]